MAMPNRPASAERAAIEKVTQAVRCQDDGDDIHFDQPLRSRETGDDDAGGYRVDTFEPAADRR